MDFGEESKKSQTHFYLPRFARLRTVSLTHVEDSLARSAFGFASVRSAWCQALLST